MRPKLINEKWYIEIYTKEFGHTLLLDKSSLPVAKTFNTETEALKYIEQKSSIYK
ncbi:hypothetical protein [Clostridium sp. CTA-6]